MRTEIVESPMSVDGSIVNYAEEEGVDLIVIGTRGRTGFAKRLLGECRTRCSNSCTLSCIDYKMNPNQRGAHVFALEIGCK